MDKSHVNPGAGQVERMPSRQRMIVFYIIVTSLYWFSLYLYMPTLPTYAEAKSGSLALVGVILAQFGLWQALVRLPIGIAADWLGRRKPFIVICMILSGLGAFLMGSAADANGMIVGRAMTGLACGAWVTLAVIFGSLFRPEEAVRATSILFFASNVARVAATALTGVLNEIGGYSLAFFLAAGIAALGALVLLPIPEQPRRSNPPSLRSIGRIITRRDVLIPALLQAVAQHATWGIPMAFIVILARNLGASNVAQSGLMTLSLAMTIVGSLAAAGLASKLRAPRLVAISFVVLVGGIVGAALAQSVLMVFVAQAFLGLAMGIGYPTMMGMSVEQVEDAERATAMGLHQSVYAVGMFSGPWLAGLLAERVGIPPMFVVTAVGVALLAAILLRLLPARPAGSQPYPAPGAGPDTPDLVQL